MQYGMLNEYKIIEAINEKKFIELNKHWQEIIKNILFKNIDIEDAKYVANIGGDWWVEQGATWKPDWSANRDVAVGQFRTITKEWKTLEMCSCPVEKIAQILGNKEFLN